MIPKGHDARLLSLPEGVQVMRDSKIRYYWYNQITDTSRRRLWRLMDRCSQLASNPDVHIWQHKSQAGPAKSQPSQQRWRVETLQFGYNDIQYSATRREAREIRNAARERPQTDKVRIVDTRKPEGKHRRINLT